MTVDNRFDLKEDLGQGGMSRVVRVHENHLNIEAALKLPLEQESQGGYDFAALAKREYQLISGISFPGLVRLFQRSSEDSEYVLMEICHGPTLDQVELPLPINIALNVLSAISASMEYVRARGIVHGDIKPHNIFLPTNYQSSQKGRLFIVKLSDFAFGRFENEPDSHRLGLGTVGYMSPEIVTDSISSHQSDLFALGVIAYQLFTGIHPYTVDSSDPVEISSRIREITPEPVREIRSECPEPLSELIQRLLSLSVDSRPQTAWDICIALQRAGSDYPFRKLLRPSYFFDRKDSYYQTIDRFFDISQTDRNRLDILCNGDSAKARLILTANFNRNNLIYRAGKFEFADNIYWPSMLRRKTLLAFSSLKLSEKKEHIRNSLGFSLTKEHTKLVSNSFSSSTNTISAALDNLLLQLLSVTSIKRVSGKAAIKSEAERNFKSASVQYLRAGKLAEAQRCAQIATKNLVAKHNNQEALHLLNNIIDLAVSTGKLFDVRQILMIKGDIYKDQGDTESAHAAYSMIVESYEKKKPDKLLAETFKDLGELHRLRRQYGDGLASLEQSLRIFEELGDELEISHSRNNIALIFWHEGKTREALTNFRLALRIQRRLTAKSDIASTINNIASVYGTQGRFRKSLKLYSLALEIQRKIGHAGEIARTLNNLGYIHHICGNVNEAIEKLTESLELNRRIESYAEILHNLENLSAVMITAGRLRTLIPYLKEGIRISSDLGYKEHLYQSQLNLVITFKRIGRLREALSILDGIEKKISAKENAVLRSSVLLEKASLCQIVGNIGQAVKFANAAHEIAKESKDPATELNVLLLLIQIHDDRKVVSNALSIAESLHLKREKTLIEFFQAARILDYGDFRQANEIVLPEIQPGDDDIEIPRICNIAAELRLEVNDVDAATKYCQRALKVASAAGLLPEQIDTHLLAGKIAIRNADYENAFSSFRKGLEIARKLSDELDNESDKKTIQQTRKFASLASEIKKLHGLLGPKKGQVN